MNEYPIELRREARLARKLQNLGTARPFCVYCGMTDCRCLFRPRASPNDPIRCRNCHAKHRHVSEAALERKRATFAAAGYPDAICVVCGEADLRTLELDHLAGEANSSFVEPLCLNCHAQKSGEAEDEPWASLRVRDPNRSALVLQAAFEFGLASILGLYAVAAGSEEGAASRAMFFGLIALALVAWAIWNLAADRHFTNILGPGYDKAISAPVPS